MANKMELIRQALNAAESSIKLAKQLMSELERSGGVKGANQGHNQSQSQKGAADNLPGIVGVFDGENMVTPTGEKLAVPANYAAKSQIVAGDTLKMVEQNGEKRFKQIQRVKRIRTTGIITKKEGKLTVVAQEGRFRVLPVAIEHINANVGDEINILIPEGNLNAGWASVEGSQSASKEAASEAPEAAKEAVKPKKEEAKEKAVEVAVVAPAVAAEVITPAPDINSAVSEEEETGELPAVTAEETPADLAGADKPQEEAKPKKEDKPASPTSTDESVLLTDEDLR